MPNESVTCPSCGSPSCTEYRANAFVCQNCDGTFRWLNPTEFTIIHRGGTCACGRRGVGGCTMCGAGVCKKHHATWHTLLSTWLPLKWYRVADPARGWLQRCVDGNFGSIWRERREQSSMCRLPVEVTAPVLKQLKFDQCTDVDLLCLACTEALFAKLLRPIENQIARLERANRLCEPCLVEYHRNAPHYYDYLFAADERCLACGTPLCFTHVKRCRGCKTAWCATHAPPEGFEGCCRCAPPSRLARFFARRFGLPMHFPKIAGRP
ncbi:MAG TPA: hypothetical protein VND64_19635 [Pirellulales bacterium]|nr:hypothetical protein [Pirellulales bacterium]